MPDAACSSRPVVQELVEVVGDVFVVQGDGMGVVPQCCRWITMPESGLRLEALALSDEMGGYPVAETMKRRAFHRGSSAEASEPVGQRVGGQERRPDRRRCEQPVILRRRPRSAHDDQCVSISAAVVAPSVSRRDRPVFVEPSTPCETFRSIVSTRLERSPTRRAASSPRRALESAATRTSRRACSALNSNRRHRNDIRRQRRQRRRQPAHLGLGGGRHPMHLVERSTNHRPDTVATDSPHDCHLMIALRTVAAVNPSTGRRASGSAANPATR
jgi:hypothetical protein